jgi:hypothetical protein
MDDTIDILSIDTEIRQIFTVETEKLPIYRKRLDDILKILENNRISNKTRNILEKSKLDISEHIENISTNRHLNFYILESAMYIEAYRKILQEPEKINFMGRSVRKNKDKIKIVKNYLNVAKNYISVENKIEDKKFLVVCQNCNNKKDFDILEGDVYVCIICSAQQEVMKNISSYKDIDRINISSKYVYDRKVHFRDCINQYQGKQNSTISQDVYNKLEEQFELHNILVGDKDTPKDIRFRNITKEHISMFLKELEFTKHYENINLIHYNLTNIKPDDIGYLEDRLMDDFDTLTEKYDELFKKNIDRKNFINTAYVLYQLLIRHRHKCNKNDFTILKTLDRKIFHDSVLRVCFEELGWTFQSYF